MISQHTIHKLLIEIEGIEDNRQFQKLADQISVLVRSSLTSRLNSLFNKYSIKGYHIVIESLEIDLQYINIQNLTNSIVQGLERELNKQLRKIQTESLYTIKHRDLSVLDYIQKETEPLHEALAKKQASSKIQISKDPSHYFPSQQLLKVLPNKAKHFDAVLYYLEYGWLPKYLDIPMLQFKELFADTVLTYDKEIKQYLRRKPQKTKELIVKRVLSQISKEAFRKKSKRHKNKLVETLFDQHSDDHIQAIVLAVEKITTDSSQTSIKRIEAIKSLISVIKSEKKIDKIGSFETILSEKAIKEMPLTKREQAELKFKKLLDSNDKESFNKLLETAFYKSIVTSYETKSDSISVLTRALIPLILNPEQFESIKNQLPEYIDGESELINQLYKKTPEIISETIKTLSFFESNRKKQIENLILFISKISKKQVNLILKTYFSYFSAFAPILTRINFQLNNKEIYIETFTEILQEFNIKQEVTSSMISPLNDFKYSQTQILVLIANTPSLKPKQVLEKYLLIIPKLILKKNESKIKTAEYKKFSAELESKKIQEIIQKVKTREYTSDKTIQLLALQNIKEDFSFTPEDKEKATIYIFKTLVKDHYIPLFDKSVEKSDIINLIKLVQEHIPRNKKSIITKLVSENNILKNQILSHLSVQQFKDFLGISLSTERARFFIKMYEKYHYLWKINIDVRQIQLIFISLIKHKREISEKSVFSYFFQELKKYKSWTYDVHKKRIIDIYELHSDKLSKESKDIIIQYIDTIPTYQSIEFKDTMKKLNEGSPVKNSGLVLLWPFMKTLFSICEYLDPKGDFKNRESRERATLLLQYLAVKSTAIEEPYLALNKVMTGFPLEESLPLEIILSDKEKDIADALLLNVIKQWPSFTNSSVENLRGSFLIRDGILTFNGKEWKLRVESKSYDLLLNKLQWGYSMIRLSWVPYIIKVEWN